MTEPFLFQIENDTLFFWVKAKPGTSRTRDIRLVEIAEDRRAVEVSVSAIAEGGKANVALIERLAKETGLKKSAFAIKSGETSRLKRVGFLDRSAEGQERLAAWLNGLSRK